MPDVTLPPLAVEPEFCVVSRWNVSLTAAARWRIFGGLAGFSLGLALLFALAGAWMVLPYSMLEIAVLAGAFYAVGRRAGDWERLTVAGDRMIVERSKGGRQTRREWNRPWVRTEMADERFGHRGRLVLRCGTERWEFGEALPEVERVAVAREIRRLVSAP